MALTDERINKKEIRKEIKRLRRTEKGKKKRETALYHHVTIAKTWGVVLMAPN